MDKKYIVFKTEGMELKVERNCLGKVDISSEGVIIDLKNGCHVIHTNHDLPHTTKTAIVTAVDKFVNASCVVIDLHNYQNPVTLEL